MAKSKRQSAGTTSQPERLNDQSLSSLTAKIEKNLSNPSKVDDSKKNKKRKHASDEPSTSHHQRKKQAHARENPTHDGKAAQTKPKGKKGGPLTRDDLLEEIRALGGDEEDLKLIGDVDSDQEETAGEAASISNDPVDGKLQNELAAFAAQLGLQQYHEEATASDLNGDDNVDEDNDQLDEDEPIAEFETANSFTNQLPAQEPTRKDAKDAPKKQFIFEPRSDWHGAELSQLPEPTSAEVDGSLGTVNALKTHALALLEADALAYTKSVLASSSRKFLSTIMSSGTLSDKVSALTLAIQESPLHNVKAFESLLGLAAKRSRAQAIGALGALVDLLGPGLVLPPNRRLRTFQTQPGLIGTLQRSPVRSWNSSQPLPGRLTEAHLVQWAYEDWLKTSYFRVIQLLEVWCNDEIEYSRTRSLDFVYGLLKDKPEQETNLLRLLVNKLGDKDRKIASRVSYLLLQLQNTHPGMKQVVIKGIEQEVLLRPGQTYRAKYHATNTLNQTILSNREVGTAEALLRIYFDIFVTLLNSSALGKASNEGQQEQVASGKESSVTTETADKLLESDRFYRTLYESLLDPRLANSSKQALYLNLLLRSLKADVDTRRIKAFAKRMLQILNMHQPAFACGLLYVVFQLRVQFPDLRALLEEPEDNDVEETAGSPVDQEQTKSVSRGTLYDGRKRNPEHSNAQNSCLWEIMAKPDLESHSLIRFLDKFVYRSPKVAEAARGASIMQPVRNPDSGSIWLAKRTGSAAAAPINTPNFWNKKIEQVAAEDIFFHEYFKQAGKKNEAGKKEAKPLASVPDEPEDDAEEDEIWKALTASHPDGPIDSDESDLDMDGFDDSDDDSDGGVVFSDGSGAELSDGGEVNEDVEGFEDEEDDDDDSDEMGHGGEASELAALPEETKEASEKSKRAGRSSKRKLKDLPMFASADDYAELLAQEEDI
ncbi:CBF/Mak21 family protein [Colletotrichum higginsianum]|nr:CBF/Mak21 family protein [Colletotrichum higginsianum]